MPAGQNQIAVQWRFVNIADDYIGGSVPSGSIINESVLLRIEPVTPTMVLLEQGLETQKLFKSAVNYGAQNIRENDILQVIEPHESWYYSGSFRVISVQHASLRPNDPRSQVQVVMRRWDEAHDRQP